MTATDIWVETMVKSQTGEPAVVIRWYDHSGELTPQEAREHAMVLLAAADAAESDAFLIRFAQQAGMPRSQQAALLNEFRKYRESREGTDTS